MKLTATECAFAARFLGSSLADAPSVKHGVTGHLRDVWHRLEAGESPNAATNLPALRAIALAAAMEAPHVNLVTAEAPLAAEAAHVRDHLRGMSADDVRAAISGEGPAWQAARAAAQATRAVLYTNAPGVRFKSYR